MKPLVPPDLGYFDTAPARIVASTWLPASPARVFDVFADAPGWTEWFPMLHQCRWTKGDGGLGAEREVALRGLGRYAERFIAWEPGVRFAFAMTGTTSPFVRQMAEDYRLRAEDGGTRLEWVMAATPTTIGRAAVPGLRVAARQLFAGAGKNLRKRLQG